VNGHMSEGVTRLAPSPTGALHLGNARTFLVNYLLARQRGWRVVMRMEDLDSPRVKKSADSRTIDELRWLGLEWDEPIFYQSHRMEAYRAALDRLIEMGVVYPCVCTRKDVALAASAPHAEDGLTVYPGTCRSRFESAKQAAETTGRPVAWRVLVPDAPIDVHDRFAGPHRFNLRETSGDFVVFRSYGTAAYQLAVVVDDAEQGVDVIVRGDDLLESAARQIHLIRLLDLTPRPTYWHLPLVVGPDGKRLAKRHGDTTLSRYRQLGTKPERLLGLLGYWCGLLERRCETTMEELLKRFDLGRIPREPITYSKPDERFLSDA